MDVKKFFKRFFLIYGIVCLLLLFYAVLVSSGSVQWSPCSRLYQLNMSGLENITISTKMVDNVTLCPVYIPECFNDAEYYNE